MSDHAKGVYSHLASTVLASGPGGSGGSGRVERSDVVQLAATGLLPFASRRVRAWVVD
ncbi:MAG: hypothetical protein MUF83_15545 [Acidimicrobiales bacterium]|nr:hypothetical protein [Acidimicrobiales bacterium]